MSIGKNTRGIKRELQLKKMQWQALNGALVEIIALLTDFGFEGVSIDNAPQVVESLLDQVRHLPGGNPLPPTEPQAVTPQKKSAAFANLHRSTPQPQPATWGLKKPVKAAPPQQAVAPDPVIAEAKAAPPVENISIDEEAFRKSMEAKLNAKIQDAEANGVRYRAPGSAGKPAAAPRRRKMSLEEKQAFMRSIGQEYVEPEGNPTMKP